MDGVLADFDAGYESAFGVRPSIEADNVDWNLVRNYPNFYLNLPPMPDFEILWDFVKPLKPVVLTGIPRSVEEACANKTAWVRRYMEDTEIRCCRSSEKCLNAVPGAILVDDWEKYKSKWLSAGGIWITHRNAVATIDELRRIISLYSHPSKEC